MRALLVTNPQATGTTSRVRDVIINALRSDLQIELVHTDHRGHAIELGERAVNERVDLVIAFGGDGTVNEIVNGLLHCGPGPHVPALAVLPGGSANVVARTLGFSNDPVEATGQLIEALREQRRRQISLGRMNGRWFVFTAGIGFDAQVVRDVELQRGGGAKASPVRYARTAVSRFLSRSGRASTLCVQLPDGEQINDAFVCIVTNTTPWTYYKSRAVHVTPEASYESGLDLFALQRIGPLRVSRLLWQVTRADARPRGSRVHIRHDLSSLVIHRETELPIQVDGDYAGDGRCVHLTSVPRAVTVIA